MIEHALAYAGRGLEIFPCKPDKTPYTMHGMKDATSQSAVIEEWWNNWPDASIGCRIPHDLIVLDVDPRHGGLATWDALKHEYGRFPPTRCHLSGRGDGGGHIWWRRPEGKLTTKPLDWWAQEHGVGHQLEQVNRWTAGIDLLHYNLRYSILPPSTHPDTGNPYLWQNGLDVDPAETPWWLEHLLIDQTPPDMGYSALQRPTGTFDDSVADWWQEQGRWTDILAGWQCVSGDGEHDGSRWRHPTATGPFSATITHGNLFVYSPNTPFEVTGAGDPHGYTKFRATAILGHSGDLAAAARELYLVRDGPPLDLLGPIVKEQAQQQTPPDAPAIDDPFHPVNWSTFWHQDRKDELWVANPLLAAGRSHALYAPAKTGKSLIGLYVAAAVATGKAVLDQPAGPSKNVVYLDYEMTPDDLYERLAEMGYGENDNLSYLHYCLQPAIPFLDTPEGGRTLAEYARQQHAELVVVDTTGRALQGDENEADTIRRYYHHTGILIKHAGITSLRVDHAGKDIAKGQRGTSAKNDDVDIVWQLTAGGNNTFTLAATHRRLGWVPEKVKLQRRDGPMRFDTVQDAWHARTRELADALDGLGAPLDISQRAAGTLLRSSGQSCAAEALRDALKWRNRASITSLAGLDRAG